MINRWRWLALQLSRRLWIRATLISLLAIVAALLAILFDPYLPSGLEARIGADAVDRILDILASSMLAVTTFSLSVMVTAYSAVTSNVTPRASKLLTEDTTTQNVLAVFVGTFLFSLVGIVGRSAGIYGETGRVLLFLVTIAVLILIVVTILHWIDHLTRFARVDEATDRIERVAARALRTRVQTPFLGGREWDPAVEPVDAGARPVHARKTGYVQFVDAKALSDLAADAGGTIFVAALPGAFVHAARPVALAVGLEDEESLDAVRQAFTIADERSYDQDPRFGLSVLAEIASRALSPALNDPGTAIDVIGRAVRVLSIWAAPDGKRDARTPEHPGLRVPAIAVDDLFYDAFAPIARDGAAIVEVQIRLQKAFAALAALGDNRFRRCASRHAGIALERARAALASLDDVARLEAAAGQTPGAAV
ncbi:MAG: DUF2254 domain-containing protein [Azospirillaceae bacterium]